MKTKRLETDVLIIGGGTAGCFAAYTLGKEAEVSVLIAEKANIKRSGCLAAGVNALNAYITEGHVPQDYVDYAKKDAHGIVREDLLLSMSERLNHVTKVLDDLGLVILKDENGKYVARGNRNIKINGENIKPLLAEAAMSQDNVTVLERVNITDYIIEENEIKGAWGFNIEENVFYDIRAKAVLCATGGAAGLYRPNNPGFSRHKMWYSPFNTGAGFAMGILAGAEMTTFEMRFIALRCKDTIAPVGTIAQGVGAKQMNSHGEIYETKYGLTTSQRLYGTVTENREGRGPCYLKTDEISSAQEQDLYRAYLNMAPSQTLKWLEGSRGPASENVEIEGTEPYIVGGHTASGYWVDNDRRTTVKGLFAAGDVAGGCPQKYVTGALAEGEIAAESMTEYLKALKAKSKSADIDTAKADSTNNRSAELNETDNINKTKAIDKVETKIDEAAELKKKEYESHLTAQGNDSEDTFFITAEQLEEAMQKVMDQYAGGIATDYQYNEERLVIGKKRIGELLGMIDELKAKDMFELKDIYEVRERLIVCQTLIEHLRARKETRWHSFGENTDYPEESSKWLKYVNSKRKPDGETEIIFRELVTGGKVYECTDFTE